MNDLMVMAGAGTGKTTTMEWAWKTGKGQVCPFTPTDEQQAIFDAFQQPETLDDCIFIAFSKKIADELEARGLTSSTAHSLGRQAIAKFGRCYVPKDAKWKTLGILFDQLKVNQDKEFALGLLVVNLVKFCKLNLTGFNPDDFTVNPTDEELDALADHHDIELNGSRGRIYELTREVLKRSAKDLNKIDYEDMLWLPVVRNLPVEHHHTIVVDEAQDLSVASRALLLKACDRMVAIGDTNQAIFGFAGADCDSMEQLAALMQARGGLTRLPLMKTRRCPKAVVSLAKTLVPAFEALPEAPEGIVRRVEHTQFAPAIGDMVLCRTNAPLVRHAYKLLQQGVCANIQGRDIVPGLLSLIKKSKAEKTVEFIRWLVDYQSQEEVKLVAQRASETRLQALQDRTDCLVALCDGLTDLSDVQQRIEKLFVDYDNGKSVLLCSAHRSKGLERNRIWIVCPEKMPHPMAKLEWERKQERNLQYVAWTRAKQELIFVISPPEKKI